MENKKHISLWALLGGVMLVITLLAVCTRYTEASIRQHTVRVIGCKRFDSSITAKKSK